MTPEEFESVLERNKDPNFREFTKKILNTPLRVIGVRTPAMRKIAKDICREDWRSFLKTETESFEQCFIKGVVIATVKIPQNERLALSKSFLPEIVDWAVCDAFCGSWKTDSAEKENLWDWAESLIGTGSEFPMRAGAVMMLNHFIDDAHIERILDILTAERKSTGYYWDMGCAWALSYCYIEYPDRTEEALFSGRLTPEILKMTVYKVRDSFRVPDERKSALKERYRKFTGKS